MNLNIRPRLWLSGLCVLIPLGVARAEEPTQPADTQPADTKQADTKPAESRKTEVKPTVLPGVGLLDAMRAGAVAVDAEGTGEGKMIITVTNQTSRKLRVVLPPGLVASGATGQFGGMGGMGMGGMGGMGGMRGGMGGGMGGMMGGRGGMMGGRGGMGMGRPLTMPATMGLMMVGRLIMTLVEPTESWNPRSLMMGMMMMGGGMGMRGGMGGMGMGGMGGGMGGMGMMGGMMSVPPTDLPDATLKPGQTRRLSTRVVSLNPPSPESGVLLPQEGEKLLIGDISQVSSDPKVQKALRRLAADKAPETISQLVLWNVAAKLDWATIVQLTEGQVNAQELALARQFVERLDTLPEGEAGRLFVEIKARESSHEKLAAELNKLLNDQTILGIKAASGVPTKPDGPSVGCKVQLVGDPDKPEALVFVAESNGHREWTSMGKFSLPVPLDAKGERDLPAFGNKLAEGLLGRLVHARFVRAKSPIDAQTTYTLEVKNVSPLILNGFGVLGGVSKPNEPPHLMLGISLPPQRSLHLKLTPGVVEAYGMKKGTHLVALDLSAL